MDGFGRQLTDQYYKAGSSLEVVCEVCFDSSELFYYSMFHSWILFRSSGIQQILANCWFGSTGRRLSNHVQRTESGKGNSRETNLTGVYSILREYSGSNIFSRLAITQVR